VYKKKEKEKGIFMEETIIHLKSKLVPLTSAPNCLYARDYRYSLSALIRHNRLFFTLVNHNGSEIKRWSESL